MKDDFKERLDKYKNDELNEEESRKFEEELDRLEIYQEYLDDEFREKETEQFQNEDKNYKKMIKKGKWKARFNTAITVIGFFVAFTMVSTIITSLFYSLGSPSRMDNYLDALSYSTAITNPNTNLNNLGIGPESYFNARIEGKIEKQVGDEFYDIGEVDANFFFNKINFDPLKLDSLDEILFINPKIYPEEYEGDWMRLQKLHEGTVAEAYLTFDKVYDTDEILEKIEPSGLNWLWLAVDTGGWSSEEFYTNIGFPSQPMWREVDGKTEVEETEKTLFGTTTVSETTSFPAVDEYGSGKLRNQNFLDTLKFLREYENITSAVDYAFSKDLDDTIAYLEENGVKIYGMVVTGPSKDILKLKDEDYIVDMRVKDVKLWNMIDFED